MTEAGADPLAEIERVTRRVREAGPFAVLLRLAPDVWDALRDLAQAPRGLPDRMLAVPVKVDEDLPAGQWRAEMSDGSVRSSGDLR